MVTHAQNLPARLVVRVGNASSIEELSDAGVTIRDAMYTCRATGIFTAAGVCSP
jgi:ribosomal protein L13E